MARLRQIAQSHQGRVKRALDQIRLWRDDCADQIWFEGILDLSRPIRENDQIVPRADLKPAEAFFANMQFEARQAGPWGSDSTPGCRARGIITAPCATALNAEG